MADPLPRTLTDRIPPELYDRIIDHLHTAKPALSACSLVCKAWLPSTRLHHLSSSPLVIRRRTAPALLALLASPHCTLREYLRSICIHPGERVRLPRFVPPLLVGLERLVVCQGPYEPIRDDLVGWMTGFSASLVEIVLVGVRDVSLARFVAMLGEVRGLRHLGLLEMVWTEDDIDKLVEQGKGGHGAPPPHLRSLVLEDYSINIVQWLISVTRDGAPRIASLDLRSISDSPTPLNIYIAELITSHYRTLGGTLEELDLYEPHLAPLNLQHTPHLRQIWFHNVTIGWTTTGQWVTDALKTVVPSSSVAVIVLEIFVDESVANPHTDHEDMSNDWIYTFDWQQFARVLSDRAKFPRLERIELFLDPHSLLRDVWLLGSVAEWMGYPEIVIRVVEMDQALQFGSLECGRVEERAQRWWELWEGGDAREWDGRDQELK